MKKPQQRGWDKIRTLRNNEEILTGKSGRADLENKNRLRKLDGGCVSRKGRKAKQARIDRRAVKKNENGE